MFNRLTYGFWGTPHFRRNLPTWKSDAVTSNDRPFTISQQIPNNPPRQKNTQSAVATRLPDRRNCHCCATSFHYTDWLIKIRSLSLYMNIYISLSLLNYCKLYTGQLLAYPSPVHWAPGPRPAISLLCLKAMRLTDWIRMRRKRGAVGVMGIPSVIYMSTCINI